MLLNDVKSMMKETSSKFVFFFRFFQIRTVIQWVFFFTSVDFTKKSNMHWRQAMRKSCSRFVYIFFIQNKQCSVLVHYYIFGEFIFIHFMRAHQVEPNKSS